jgi:hypothetical protein
MYKIRNNDIMESMTSMFNVSQNTHYSLHSNKIDFDLQKPNTNFMKKSISYPGAILWNDLPKLEKEKHISIGRFKTIVNSNNCTWDDF